jgi:hypothetical protein
MLAFNDDRRVHASHPVGEEIVRYDRRGHWHVELVEPAIDAPWRGRVTIDEAVRRAIELEEQGGQVNLGVPGGRSFDAKYRKAKS